MNVAITDICPAVSTSENFSELENLLGVQLHNINLKQVKSQLESLRIDDSSLPGLQKIGIVIPVAENGNILKKIWSLMYTARKAREVERRLKQLTASNFASYGVYPDLCNPVAIYQLKSPAEKYANQHLLPPFKSGINGFLRRLIFSIVNFHPSTAGIIVVSKIS